jgi:cysteine desulfurase
MLFVRDGVRIEPLLYGGPHEWGRRAGREDVSAAIAVAVALATCAGDRKARAAAAYSQSLALQLVLRDVGGTLTGAESRLPNIASCVFADRKGEDMLLALDLAGVAASSGSACAAGSLDPSHVLLAMGMSMEQALGSLRLSVGYATTDELVVDAGQVLYSVLNRTKAYA